MSFRNPPFFHVPPVAGVPYNLPNLHSGIAASAAVVASQLRYVDVAVPGGEEVPGAIMVGACFVRSRSRPMEVLPEETEIEEMTPSEKEI